MPSIDSQRKKKSKRQNYKENKKRPVYIPPPIQPGQKSESLDRRIRNLETSDQGILLGNVLASYLALPGLVGFWPMSSVQRSTGNCYDLSGQGRTLTYNGNPAYTYYNGLVPYIDLDGTGDYLSRTDETDLDITGTESVFTSGVAGLTMGGWFWMDAIVNGDGLMSKDDSASVAGSAYTLQCAAGNSITFRAFGVSENNITSAALSTGVWYFLVGRFVPSVSVDLWVNLTKSSNTTSIVASLNNSASPFNIGNRTSGGASLLDGRVSLCFLCANALGDDLISYLYQTSRVLFDV